MRSHIYIKLVELESIYESYFIKKQFRNLRVLNGFLFKIHFQIN